MKISLKGKKSYILLFSLTCALIIFTLHKSFNIASSNSSNSIRNLIEQDEYKCRCDNTLKKFKDKYRESPNEIGNVTSLEKYERTLKEVLQDKKFGNIRKYLPRIIIYLIVAIIDIIFIIFWILFCCYSCRTVGKQNRIGCGAKCSFIIYFILCLVVIGFCVLGIIYYPCFTKGLNNLGCSIYKMVFHSLYGFDDKNENIHWIGLDAIYKNITDLEDPAYDNALRTIDEMTKTFSDINNKTLKDLEEVLEKVYDKRLPTSIVIFGIIALFNLLGLISMFLIFVCECKCMSCLFHLFWNIEIILIIATFFLSACIGTAGIMSKDLSTILKYQKNNLNETCIIDLSEINDNINICLNGDGDLITYILEDRADNFYAQMRENSSFNPEVNIREFYNCEYFKLDYNIITEELKDTIAKKLYFMSLLLIIIDVAGIVSIFFGITVYNSQKEYCPPPSNEMNVNINNNRMLNNRADLSTENLKRQNNEVIFNKKIN